MKKKVQLINAIRFPSLSVYIATAAVFHKFSCFFFLLTTKANEAYEYYFNYCYFVEF